MVNQLLREEFVFPDENVLQNALGNVYPVFEEFFSIIKNNDYSLVPQWKFYKDGKAWLCKVVFKKKTILWISVCDRSFKTTFYFTEKSGLGIQELDIENCLKEDFKKRNMIGKLKPLSIDVVYKKQIKDLLKLVEYKKRIK